MYVTCNRLSPSVEALRKDIELARGNGFQWSAIASVFEPLYFSLADELGFMVCEFPDWNDGSNRWEVSDEYQDLHGPGDLERQGRLAGPSFKKAVLHVPISFLGAGSCGA